MLWTCPLYGKTAITISQYDKNLLNFTDRFFEARERPFPGKTIPVGIWASCGSPHLEVDLLPRRRRRLHPASVRLRRVHDGVLCAETSPDYQVRVWPQVFGPLLDTYHWKYPTPNSTLMHLLGTVCCQYIHRSRIWHCVLIFMLW